MTAYTAIPAAPANRADAAAAGLSFLLIVGAVLLGGWVVGTRGIDVGTDTSVYAGFFESLGHTKVQTRLEPGFVFISYVIRMLGFGVHGYQAMLFWLLLLTAFVASLKYFRYVEAEKGFLTFLSASIMLLYFSPMFVNASINAIRQGLVALVVFSALLSFQRRQWLQFIVLGAIATSVHVSALLYLACAPALLVSPRVLRYIAAGAFLLYVSGLSMKLVQMFAPPLYAFVMSYAFNPDYRSGVRVDFAVFSIFWYVLPHLFAPLIREAQREQVLRSAAVYLVMVLPFFAVGWGSYSNRFLLPAWLSASLIVAAIICYSRISVLRNPLLIHFGLIVSSGVFFYYVRNSVVI